MGWLQNILSINLEVNLAKELHNYPILPPKKKITYIFTKWCGVQRIIT